MVRDWWVLMMLSDLIGKSAKISDILKNWANFGYFSQECNFKNEARKQIFGLEVHIYGF